MKIDFNKKNILRITEEKHVKNSSYVKFANLFCFKFQN